MKIAYINSYLGCQMIKEHCSGKSYAISGNLKCQGIARALMLAGHEVINFSSGITTCNKLINSFEEIEQFPEGRLRTIYSKIISKPKCSPINAFLLKRKIKATINKEKFDIMIYYNISIEAILSISLFKNAFKIIEYEDNIFNKALEGKKNKFVWLKKKAYNHLINRTNAAMVVCTGMLNKNEVKNKVLIPGIINDSVLNNISAIKNELSKNNVKIALTGGTHYSKGPDLLIEALQHVQHPCEVHFFTNGSFYQKALDAIDKVPQKHKIINNGYVEHGKLIKLLTERMDIFINTTRKMSEDGNSEGFPFKMMEYAAIGKPIISSIIGKLNEDFNKNITYYEKEDPRLIAKCINEVIENYDYKIQCSKELRDYVLKRYTIEGVANELKLFINNVYHAKTKTSLKE